MSEIKVLCIILAILFVLGLNAFLYCKDLKDNYPQETFPIPTYIPEETETIGFVPSPEPSTSIPTEEVTISKENELITTPSTSIDTETTPSVIETEPFITETVPSLETEENITVDTNLIGFDPYEIAPNGMTNRELLACVVYQEAGWSKSCDECRKMIADVVLNRVASQYFPNTIYEVLMQKGQYGRYYWDGITWPAKSINDINGKQRAYDAVDAIIRGEYSKLHGTDYWWQIETTPLGSDIIYCCGTYYGRGTLA